MGDILRMLGIGGHPQAQAQAQGQPNLANLVQHVGGGVTPGDEPLNQAPDQSPIVVQGDSFHGRKPSLLAILGDAMLVHGGYKPQFSQNRRNEDYRRAMSDFTQDPIAAIRRVSRLQGRQKDAWDMYNTYEDNSRQGDNLTRQNNIFDMKKEELVYNRVASMMGAANANTWGKMRELAQSTADRYGVDISTIVPEQYDPDSIEYIRAGAIKPKDQERIAQSDRRLDQADTRIGETGRHNRATEGQAATNEAGRNNRHDNPVARPTAPVSKPYMTKYGPMVMSKDGTKGYISRGGVTHGYVRINDKMVPIGEVKIK